MEKTNDFLINQVNKGKRVVQILMTLNIALTILIEILSVFAGVFSGIHFISAIIMIIICAFIYGGSKTAKWIYIVLAGFSVLRFLSFLISMNDEGVIVDITLSNWLAVITPFLIYTVTSLLLIFSESVNEFIYKQAN